MAASTALTETVHHESTTLGRHAHPVAFAHERLAFVCDHIVDLRIDVAVRARVPREYRCSQDAANVRSTIVRLGSAASAIYFLIRCGPSMTRSASVGTLQQFHGDAAACWKVCSVGPEPRNISIIFENKFERISFKRFVHVIYVSLFSSSFVSFKLHFLCILFISDSSSCSNQSERPPQKITLRYSSII